jgi:pimeloyl-ACP methyl ester carboxylesterase
MGMTMPETRYARSGDVSIAYQVVDEGPFDVVMALGSVSHVELQWEIARMAALLRGVAEHARVLVFDKRGTGLSDRVAGVPTLEERSDDIRAVMDAAGSERAALAGAEEGVPMSVVFAASYPERVSALVLHGGVARVLWAPDYQFGDTEREYRKELEEDLEAFVTPGGLEALLRHSYPSAGEEEVPGPGASDALWLQPCNLRGAVPDEHGDRRARCAARGQRPDAGGPAARRSVDAGRARPLPRPAHPGRGVCRTDRGLAELKGVPGEWRPYSVASP